jgi:NADPH2:quinone reductase
MSAVVVATAFGGSEVLSVIDEDVPTPGLGEVMVAVRAAGVNPIDFKRYSGAMGADPSSLPMRLGVEAAGVVLSAGRDAVSQMGLLAVGDEVVGTGLSGAYAAQVLAPATAFVRRPSTLDWQQAAGLLATGTTAIHLLTAADVTSGDTVLVHAASGGVGLMVIQLAIARGARVIGTASPSRHDLLRGYGAEPVAYGPGLAERVRALAPGGIDVALDLVGTDEAVDVSLDLVANRSRIVTIAAFGRGRTLGIQLLGGGPGADPGTDIRYAARLELVQLAEAGTLTVIVERAFPLAEVAAAHDLVRLGHTAGKVVLVP